LPLGSVAERVGFEPTVAINHTAFRERPIEARAGSLWAAEGRSEYESGADRATAGWSGTSNVAAAGAKMATVGADLGTNFSIWGRLRPRSGPPGHGLAVVEIVESLRATHPTAVGTAPRRANLASEIRAARSQEPEGSRCSVS